MNETVDKSPRKNKLQTMSEFATMRFELRNNNLYQTKNNAKKTTYSRFGKFKQKEQRSTSSAKLKQNRENLLKIQEAVPQEEPEEDQPKQEFHLKYLQKLSNEHILVGNEYQLDMLKLSSISHSFIDVNCKWSICPSDLITSLSIDTKYSMIAASLGKNVDILKYNLKRQHQCPEIIVKHTHQEQVQYVRFVRNMSMFVILQSKIEFYRINIVCEKAELSLCFVHKMNYGPNMKLYHVPQTIDNTLILYFYENKVKPQERNKFGLWMQLIEAKATSDTPSVGKLMLNYNIEVRDRKEFSIYNYNKDICLIKFKFTIIATKNGFVIDETNTNFHSQHSFIEYVETSNKVVHFRKTFIDLYQLSMNFNNKPETIQLECLDSISFIPPNNGKLFKVIELEPQCYAIFYENSSKNLKTNPQLEYTFCISQEANLMSKIDILYPSKQEIQHATIEALQDTCSEAKKLGMTNKEVYYELWRRSSKTSKMDYHILISTEDFGTIEREIEKKLKSQSMSIRQVINIYTEALQMLKLQVLGPKCTINTLIEYSSCQFSLRKFQMLRYLRNQQKIASRKDTQQESNQVLIITIKDYYEYSDMQILQELVELIGNYLQKQQELTIRKIQAILKYFKLIFRLNYIQTLERIVAVSKMRVIQIIQAIPELLPYLYQAQGQGLGVWTEISQEEKDQNVFLNSLMTIDNRMQIQEFTKHIWFRRHNKIRHGVILVKKEQINTYLTVEYCKFQDIFYKFLVQIYHFKTYDDRLWQLVQYIEQKYPFLPTHLKGKFKLYIFLYQIFVSFKQQYEMQDFLRAKECQLFKRYFERQKIEKGGFILKKIRPVYQKILQDGTNVFNQGLYNYFASPESTVADLKCILNKLNNEKNEFHITAEKMYQVLINAIMKKITIGSDCDTPIDEILVYIENIPFPIHNSSIMANLQYIQEINYESEILKKIRVNMTLQQVVDRPKQVIEMMVEYEVNRHEVFNLREYRSLRLHAYKILAEVQCRKSNIYGQQQHSYGLKIFLICIMRSKQMIQLCSKLLKDEYLKSQYHIYSDVIEEVVMILYHWKLKTEERNQNNYYLLHIEYIKALTLLLEPNNPKRKYIQYSIQYAELLTFEGFKITYPLFSSQIKYPTLSDFIQTINCLSASEMAQIRLKDLFAVMINLKKLKEDDIQNSQQLKIYEKKLEIEVYEHLIVRLIEQKQLKSALENIFYLLSLPQQYSQYSIVFPCLIIEKLIPELLMNSIQLIIKLISYYYNSPFQLVSIIKQLFSRTFSNQEIDAYLELKIKQQEAMAIFGLNNGIISDKIKLSWESNPKDVNKLLELCLQRIIRYNQGYQKSWHLHILYRLMCHNPLVISKWLYCKKAGINVKTIRSFISYMSLEVPFKHEETVLAGKEIFQIIRFHYTHHIFFSQILKWREKISFERMQQLASMNQIDSEDRPLDLINECIEAFEQKLLDLRGECKRLVTEEKQKVDMGYMMAHLQDYFQQPLSQYIYKDKDDWYQKGSDELFLPSKRRSRSNLRQETDPKYSQTAERPNYKFQQLIVPGQANRPRKYTEYFPEMLDVQQLTIEIQPSRKHQTPKHQTSVHFDTALQNQILEDNNQNMSSYLQIDIGSQEVAKDGNRPDSLRSIQMHMQGEMRLGVEIESKKGRRSILSESGSEASSRQVPSESDEALMGGFQINVLDDKQTIEMPAQDLAEKLLSEEPDQSGRFDLNQLQSIAQKPNFQRYLRLLLQQIYNYSLVSFQKRSRLIQAISSLYHPQYTQKQGIAIFSRGLTLKIPHLSFDIVGIIPIDVVFQQSQDCAFIIIAQHLLPKLNSINIYQALQLVNHLFRDNRFKDQLLVRFILHRLREAKSEAELQKNTDIIITLFDQFSALNECLQKSIKQLKTGDTNDFQTAQILRKLALQYKIQSQ